MEVAQQFLPTAGRFVYFAVKIDIYTAASAAINVPFLGRQKREPKKPTSHQQTLLEMSLIESCSR